MIEMDSDKLKAARQAKELLSRKFVIFDTETTGFDNDDEIVQIAIIDQDGEPIIYTYIKPEKSIRNSHIHGITDATVQDAMTFPQWYNALDDALSGKVAVAYNFDFDSRMLRQVCRMHGLGQIEFQDTFCVMEVYAMYFGEWNDYYSNYRWVKLKAAVADCGLKFEGEQHDSLADAKATLAVLKAMADWYDQQAGEQP